MEHNMISETNFLGPESSGSSFQLSIPVKTILFFSPFVFPFLLDPTMQPPQYGFFFLYYAFQKHTQAIP
jgi:hypothetical protein